MLEAMWAETMELHWSSYKSIGFVVIEVEKFGALRKKIKRHNGNYVRVSAGDNLFYVLTDAVDEADCVMSVAEAIEKLKWCMHNAPCPRTKRYLNNDSKFRVVTTSDGWRQLHRTETFPEYETIGKGIPNEVIERALVEMGKTFEIVTLNERSGLVAMCALLDTTAEYEQFKIKVRNYRKACPHSHDTGKQAGTLYLKDSMDARADKVPSIAGNAGDSRLIRREWATLSFMHRRT